MYSFNEIISLIHRAKFMKFGGHVVEGHSERTMSQVLYSDSVCHSLVQTNKFCFASRLTLLSWHTNS